MAVEDKYVDSNIVAGKLADPGKVGIGTMMFGFATASIAVADDDGSKYRLFKALPANLIPLRINILNDAITGGTSFSLGLYEAPVNGVLGPVVSGAVGCFMSAVSLATANTVKSTPTDGLAAVSHQNLFKTLWEYAGHTIKTRKSAYDLVLTANTVGTAAGNVTVIAEFLQS